MTRIAILVLFLCLGKNILFSAQNVPIDNFDYIRNISTTLGAVITDRYISMTMQEQLTEMNFDSELHEITTQDGYILKMFRIVNPYLAYRPDTKLKPVLIQHGLLSNSDFFITTPYPTILGANNVLFNDLNQQTSCDPGTGQVFASSFALMLANCGYDVWLGNFRGNYYSSGHVNYTQMQPRFWNYTIDSLSEFDLPDMVDHVLEKTNRKSLAYIAHSMGTTAMFQLLAEKPEYRSKVDLFVAMAPVGPMSNDVGVLERIFTPMGVVFSSVSANAMIFPSAELAIFRRTLAEHYCRYTFFLPACFLLVNLISGFGKTNPLIVPQGIGHYPDTGSTKLLSHMAQRIQSNFTMYKYDYGEEGNIRKYGQHPPPVYDLSSIDTTKIILMSGSNDELASIENVKQLAKQLKNVYVNYKIDGYNHRDYIFGTDASIKIVKWMLETLPEAYPK